MAHQRKIHGLAEVSITKIYLKLYQAVMTSIRVHVAPVEVIKGAVTKMDAIMASYKFTDDKIKTAATKFVDNYRRQAASGRGSLGHTVGMEVHDVRMPTPTLEPGEIFTMEPEMRIEELHLGLRLEDMLLITETGYENLSAFVPIEIRDIEKVMADHKHGLSEAHFSAADPRRLSTTPGPERLISRPRRGRGLRRRPLEAANAPMLTWICGIEPVAKESRTRSLSFLLQLFPAASAAAAWPRNRPTGPR